MKYLKQFETEAAYVSYKDGSEFITPNVSWIKAEDIVFYNPQEIPSRQSMERFASDCNFRYDDMFGYWLISSLPEEYKLQNSIKNIILKPKNVSVENIPHIGKMFFRRD